MNTAQSITVTVSGLEPGQIAVVAVARVSSPAGVHKCRETYGESLDTEAARVAEVIEISSKGRRLGR